MVEWLRSKDILNHGDNVEQSADDVLHLLETRCTNMHGEINYENGGKPLILTTGTTAVQVVDEDPLMATVENAYEIGKQLLEYESETLEGGQQQQ